MPPLPRRVPVKPIPAKDKSIPSFEILSTDEDEDSDDEEFLADGGSQPLPTSSYMIKSQTIGKKSQIANPRGAGGSKDQSSKKKGPVTMESESESLLVPDNNAQPSVTSTQTSKYSDDVFNEFDGGSDRSVQFNDPHWNAFRDSVHISPQTAHTKFATTLVESGSQCSALLGKIIYRSFVETKENPDLYQKYCAVIIRGVLHLTIHHESASTGGVVVDVVNMMFTELRHFSSEVLYSIVELCIEYMKKEKDSVLPPRWIEIFGKIIAVMSLRGDIKHELDVIDGKAFKEHVVNEICRLRWTTENTASLIAILREIPCVEDSELRMIFTQLRSCVSNIKASAFPPIIHQLILLAGSRCPSELLSICVKYFQNVNFTDQNSLEVKQKRNALGTVVFHFLEAARHCDSVVRAVVKVVKDSVFDFEKTMSPFMLSVTLGLTTFEHAKSLIIDPLRSSILKSFYSMHLSQISHWYNQSVGDSKDVASEAFKAILEQKSSELEFMMDGLRELAIGLLNADVYQIRYPNTLHKCHKLGKYLIISIMKSCPDQLSVMMKDLLKISAKSTVHIECLAEVMQLRTRQIILPALIGRTSEIIRHLPLMDSNSAAMIVKSLSTAFHLSYTLLDQLMLNLRKTVWKTVDARRTAAKIMIILLSNSRVVGDIPFSQYSESQRISESQGQQLSSNLGQLPDKQPLCIEILTLTKRCFSQQCEIRKELYLGFNAVVRKNPGLCELICSQLYNHGSQYLTTPDENETSQIQFSKVVELSGNNAIIKEELGFMVQCLCCVVIKSYQAFSKFDEGPPAAVEQLEALIKQWIDCVLALSPGCIGIAAADAVSEAGGARPLDVVRYVGTAFIIQILQVIEALMEYLLQESGSKSQVNKLFQKYKAIELELKKEKEKAPKGKGKGEKSKGKGNKTKDTSKDDEVTIVDSASETSETSNNPTVRFKKPDSPKKLALSHIINLETIVEMTEKLHSSETDRGALQTVAKDSEFEKLLLATIKQKLASFKRKEPTDERSRSPDKIAQTFADIAGAIWMGVMKNPDGRGSNSEAPAAITVEMDLRLEIIHEIVTCIISSYPSVHCHLIRILSDEEDETLSYDELFPKFYKAWKTIIGWTPFDPEGQSKVHHSLFEILQTFAGPLSPDDTSRRNQSVEVCNWIWGYMSFAPSVGVKANFTLAECVVACWLTYYMKAKGVLIQPGNSQHDVLWLACAVRTTLGISMEEESMNETENREAEAEKKKEKKKYRRWIINENSASTVLCVIMNYIENLIVHMQAILMKLKSHQSTEESLQRATKIRENCFNLIEQMVRVSAELVVTDFPPGICATTMLKVIPQLFSVVTGFGEYFMELSKNKVEFSIKGLAAPVSVIGKDFKPLVEAMIQHIEQVQRRYMEEVAQKTNEKGKKAKGPPKVSYAVKNQLVKDKKLIPNMVYCIEKYDQQIIALSNKTKDQKGIRLLVGMKLSTARDFKIDGTKLIQTMENRTRIVQNMTTVPDEETRAAQLNTTAGPSKERVRKGKKRKTEDTDD